MSVYLSRARAWFVLLVFALALALALAFFNWFVLVRASPMTKSIAPASVPSFSRARLDEVLALYKRRAGVYEGALRALPPIADPAR
jgi:hypothetical protein